MLFREMCFLCFGVMLCSVFDSASSLRCYECTESEPKSCGTPFDRNSVTVTDCQSSIYTVDDNTSVNQIYACLFIQETDVLAKNITYTRRCSIKNSADTCENIVVKNQMASQNLRTSCTQCENDLCNSASNLNKNFIMILVMVAFMVFRL